ncbi:hypothetical protein [Allobaculum mucilyticum]|uniref:hypothetical protein n=1 Tax=Allobaculum mucilyticum TaxID=2834459 RepID=UPI001E5C71B9|nr:hypothetical protein [Allobaculum mucilyticum]UNT97135.1 hypothetical protein KWG62_05140 [Allobaculum mucilyticum]
MNDNNASRGIGFFGLLTIVLIALKLCKVISWSWWWVLAPVWINFLLLVLVALVIVLGSK